ncbi:MAG: hypothetical protein HUK16_04105 [Bacteroidales bacterium]|nr:hypothetical protein [Bacteroidales bacterium]
MQKNPKLVATKIPNLWQNNSQTCGDKIPKLVENQGSKKPYFGKQDGGFKLNVSAKTPQKV